MGCSQSQPLLTQVGDPVANLRSRHKEMKSVLVEAIQAHPRRKKAEASNPSPSHKFRFLNETALSRIRDSNMHIKSFRNPRGHHSVVSNTFDTQSFSILGNKRGEEEGSGDTLEANKNPTADPCLPSLVREDFRGTPKPSNLRDLKKELKKCLPGRGRRSSDRFGSKAQGSKINFNPSLSQVTLGDEILVSGTLPREAPPTATADHSKTFKITRQKRKPNGKSHSLVQVRLIPAKPGQFDRDRGRDNPKRRNSMVVGNLLTAPNLPCYEDPSQLECKPNRNLKIRLIPKQRIKESQPPKIKSMLTALSPNIQAAQTVCLQQQGGASEDRGEPKTEEKKPPAKPKVLYSHSIRKKPDTIMYFPFVVKKKRKPIDPTAHNQTRDATSPSMRNGLETYSIYINGRFDCKATRKPKQLVSFA